MSQQQVYIAGRRETVALLTLAAGMCHVTISDAYEKAVLLKLSTLARYFTSFFTVSSKFSRADSTSLFCKNHIMLLTQS